VGLVGIIMVKTLTPAFYARQDFQTPVRIAIGVIIAVQLMNLFTVDLMGGVAGLALSISLGACINGAMLFFLLRKRGIFIPQAGWLPFFFKLVVAVLVMGAVAWFAGQYFQWVGPGVNRLLRAVTLFGIVAVSGAAYFAVLFALGFRPRDFKRTGQ
jgi:putative peptidoglycan lipid II flippase